MKKLILILFIMVNMANIVACTGNANNNYNTSKVNNHNAALLNVQMAEQYLQKGKLTRAKKKILHAIELSPKLPEAYQTLGDYYQIVNEHELAEKNYKLAITMAKSSPQRSGSKSKFYQRYGEFLCQQQRFDDAEKILHLAIADNEYLEIANAYQALGQCYYKNKKYTLAKKYLNKSIKYDRALAAAPLLLADLEIKIGKNYKAADGLLFLYEQHNPINAYYTWLKIQLYRKINNIDKLRKHILLLKTEFSDSPEYQLYLQSIDYGKRG